MHLLHKVQGWVRVVVHHDRREGELEKISIGISSRCDEGVLEESQGDHSMADTISPY